MKVLLGIAAAGIVALIAMNIVNQSPDLARKVASSFVPATPVPRPQASPQAQAAAVARYPALAKPGSALHSEFMARLDQLSAENPNYFANANWPLALATESQQALAAAEADQRRASAAAAADTKARLARAEKVVLRVERVVADGAVVLPFTAFGVGNSNGSGGAVYTEYRPGSKLVFMQGLPSATEGQRTAVLAYRDGVWTKTDTSGSSRTFERWVFVGTASEG